MHGGGLGCVGEGGGFAVGGGGVRGVGGSAVSIGGSGRSPWLWDGTLVVRRGCGSPVGAWVKILDYSVGRRRKIGPARGLAFSPRVSCRFHATNTRIISREYQDNEISQYHQLAGIHEKKVSVGLHLLTPHQPNMALMDESQVDMPPSYGSQEYWNKRFATEREPFEWLGAPDVLDPYLRDALHSNIDPKPEVLHIGCGTSNLSYHLRTIVNEPERVHNLDYSEVAIDIGRKREQELCTEERFEDQQVTSGATSESMCWDAVDMLDHQSFLRICKPGAYSIIMDKSTSDSISCCDDVHIQLPYTIDIWSGSPTSMDLRSSPERIHPLHILAVHMAVATKPGARWIALSYSNDRFPFVDGLYSSRPHISGFPDTGQLWKLLDKREVQEPGKDSVDRLDGGRVVHRPRSTHWVYILQRTEVPLFVRGSHI